MAWDLAGIKLSYLAIAAATSLPHDSYIRMLVAKSALIITVADDFYDMVDSLSELEGLTDAVRTTTNINHPIFLIN